ncbi:MAG: bifunctional 4-hydroxy-2-oxoglutarate aldolase/2-dehydro-3-deoxy-phosphogluconate aldolase [Limisphaerales bacterium]
MNDPRFDEKRFDTLPVVGILRGFSAEETAGALAAAVRGGLTTAEITLDTPGATDQIRAAIEEHGHALNVGAGTVTSVERLEQALAAGATFVVTPTLVQGVIERCVARGIPVFPGALSPTEIVRAWDLGARLVKVFPADGKGARFIAALKEALPEVGLMPTGGVRAATLGEFARAGAGGFGVGGPLFDRERVASGDWGWVEAQCRSFREAWQACEPVRA